VGIVFSYTFLAQLSYSGAHCIEIKRPAHLSIVEGQIIPQLIISALLLEFLFHPFFQLFLHDLHAGEAGGEIGSLAVGVVDGIGGHADWRTHKLDELYRII